MGTLKSPPAAGRDVCARFSGHPVCRHLSAQFNAAVGRRRGWPGRRPTRLSGTVHTAAAGCSSGRLQQRQVAASLHNRMRRFTFIMVMLMKQNLVVLLLKKRQFADSSTAAATAALQPLLPLHNREVARHSGAAPERGSDRGLAVRHGRTRWCQYMLTEGWYGRAGGTLHRSFPRGCCCLLSSPTAGDALAPVKVWVGPAP